MNRNKHDSNDSIGTCLPDAEQALKDLRRLGQESIVQIPDLKPLLFTRSARPHEAADCACRGCVAFDVGEDLVAELERRGPTYGPAWAPIFRKIGAELELEAAAFQEKFGPFIEAMALQARESRYHMLVEIALEARLASEQEVRDLIDQGGVIAAIKEIEARRVKRP